MLLAASLRDDNDRLVSQKPVQSDLASTLPKSRRNLVKDLERAALTSSNPPLTERTVRDQGELLPFAIRKNLLLNSPVYRAVFHLVRDNRFLRQGSLSLPHLPHRQIAHAYVPH